MNPYLFSRIRGPVFLLVFAVTAILAQQHILGFDKSWPLYLIASGLLRIAGFFWMPNAVTAGYPGSGMYGFRWRRHRGLTSGVVLLGFGLVALLLTTGALSANAFWPAYSRWWPLLLILIGVLLLLDRTVDRRGAVAPNGAPVAYYPRRSYGIGWIVAILIILGIFGHTGNTLWNSHKDWSDNLLQFGDSHSNDLTLNAPMTATSGGTLSVENPRGDIQLAASEDGQIHVQAHQTVRTNNDRDAEREFHEARPILEVHGSSAVVRVPQGNRVAASLVITVPASVLATLQNANGDVTVSGLKGGLTVNQSHGDVSLAQLDGPIHINMDHGDVSARDLGGELQVSGRVDDVSFSGVKGRASLNGDFFGDTSITGTGAGVSFHSSRTQLDISKLSGQLSLDSKTMSVNGADGGLKIYTRSKDIDASGISGNADIEDTDGDVNMTASAPLGTVSIVNRNGDISLTVPENANFSVEGRAGSDGDINSQFAITRSQDGSTSLLKGQIGQGGPHVQLQADHGDLTLNKGSASSADSGTKKTAKHLHTDKDAPVDASVQ